MSKLSARTQNIYAALEGAADLYNHLCVGPLETRLRKAAANRLFPDAQRLVTWTAEVLDDSPQAFGDIATDPIALQEQQDHADALRLAAAVLADLSRRCSDEFLITQAGAVVSAEAVIETVRKDRPSRDETPEQRLRRTLRASLMTKAEAFLRRRLPYRTGGRLAAGEVAQKKDR